MAENEKPPAWAIQCGNGCAEAMIALARQDYSRAAELLADTLGFMKYNYRGPSKIRGIHENTRNGAMIIGHSSSPPTRINPDHPAARAAAGFPGGMLANVPAEPGRAIDAGPDITVSVGCPTCGMGPYLNGICQSCGFVLEPEIRD